MESVSTLIGSHARESTALRSLDKEPSSYSQLQEQLAYTRDWLNERGIGRNDTVAIVLPNGADMASAFLAVSASAISAPLNPAYRAQEYEFYLSDLNASLLIVEADCAAQDEAIAVAERLGIPVAYLAADPAMSAGRFTLSSEMTRQPASQPGYAGASDRALVLHTSGTTSRPKLVPLTHRNLCTSARNVAASLALTPDDVCLNIMPLFHIHGLVAALLGSLQAGASVCCTPGFNALKFFSWMESEQPTWYTGVPTMHQTILARAKGNEGVIANSRLRFIRSSSASLPPQVMQALAETFRVPVVEAYGMTEAAHQISINPLVTGQRPGSVGLPAGPAVCVLDENASRLQAGQVGEIAISGANVTAGYLANESANQEAYVDQWFRTGDQGYFDEDGFLFLTGRLKEIINRGGEKISPREVDEVLLDYEGVEQVVTFAMPHDKLGEEVAAAVVCREGMDVDPEALRRFAATRLADFKVPRKILLLDDIPKGPTGKLQRIGLAEKLGLT